MPNSLYRAEEDFTDYIVLREPTSATPYKIHIYRKGTHFFWDPQLIVRSVSKHYHRLSSDRISNPNDINPDLGFRTLSAMKEYIPHQRHHVLNYESDGLVGFWSNIGHESISTGSNNGYYTIPTPFLRYEHRWDNTDPAYMNAREIAIRNLYGSLAKRRRLEVGIMLGELRETLNLLGTTALDLIEIYRAIRKGNINKAIKIMRNRGKTPLPTSYPDRREVNKRRAKKGQPPLTLSEYASNAWLELQFGWLPLFNDLYAIAKLVQETLNSQKESPWFSYSGYGSDVRFGYIYRPVTHNSPLPNYLRSYQAQMMARVKWKVGITASFKLSSDALDFLNKLGLDNPAFIAWNLMPLSFVVDWILPVGKWLESFTAYAGLELIQITPSIKLEESAKLVRYIPGPVSPQGFRRVGRWEHAGKSTGWSAKSFSRIPWAITDLPPFPQRTTFKELLQPWKLITASALIRQLQR